MSNPNSKAELSEFIAEQKEKWLEDRGLSFKDVMIDEDGEYVMQEPQLMDEDEPESGEFKKVLLPDFTENL